MRKGNIIAARPMKATVKVIALVFLVCGLALNAGCSSQDSAKQPGSVQDVVERLEKASLLADLQAGDLDTLGRLYGLDASQVEDFALYTAPSNIRAEEILVLKLKDVQDMDEVRAKIQERIAKRADSFRDYLPEQYALIENHCLMTAGNYVFLAIVEDVAAAEEAFRNAGR